MGRAWEQILMVIRTSSALPGGPAIRMGRVWEHILMVIRISSALPGRSTRQG